jgi:hypothetical protein
MSKANPFATSIGEDFDGPYEDVMPDNEHSVRIHGVLDGMDRSLSILHTEFGNFILKVFRDVRATGDPLMLDKEAMVQLRDWINERISK